jgi:hypothetical protein
MPDLGAIIRQRPFEFTASTGDCYSAPRMPRLDHLDANYGHDPGRDQTVQPSAVLMSVQGGRSAHGLLYLAAVPDGRRQQEHRQVRLDVGELRLCFGCSQGEREWSNLAQ